MSFGFNWSERPPKIRFNALGAVVAQWEETLIDLFRKTISSLFTWYN